MKLLAVLLVISLAALADAWYRPYAGYRGGWGGGWGGYGGYRGGFYRPYGRSLESPESSESSERVARYYGYRGGFVAGGYRGGYVGGYGYRYGVAGYRPWGRALESLESSESSDRVSRQWGYGGWYRPYWGGYYRGYGGWGGYYRPYWGYRGYWGRAVAQQPVQDVYEANAVHCALSRNDSMISCRSPSTIIECPIVLNMTGITQKFEFFGISRIAGMNYSSIEPWTQWFRLFPRSVDNTRWLNYSQPITGGRSASLKFYFGEGQNGCTGIRVMDRECYADISRLFCSIEHRLRVAIDGDSNRMCDFFGDLMMI